MCVRRHQCVHMQRMHDVGMLHNQRVSVYVRYLFQTLAISTISVYPSLNSLKTKPKAALFATHGLLHPDYVCNVCSLNFIECLFAGLGFITSMAFIFLTGARSLFAFAQTVEQAAVCFSQHRIQPPSTAGGSGSKFTKVEVATCPFCSLKIDNQMADVLAICSLRL